MSLSTQDVKKIAKLSCIKITEEEAAKYQVELNSIFQWIEQLQSVNTDGVEPLCGVEGQMTKTREDVVTDGDKRDQVLKNAPVAKYGYFAVPKVIE